MFTLSSGKQKSWANRAEAWLSMLLGAQQPSLVFTEEVHTFDAIGLQTDGIVFQEVSNRLSSVPGPACMCTNAGMVYSHKEIHTILSLKDGRPSEPWSTV